VDLSAFSTSVLAFNPWPIDVTNPENRVHDEIREPLPFTMAETVSTRKLLEFAAEGFASTGMYRPPTPAFRLQHIRRARAGKRRFQFHLWNSGTGIPIDLLGKSTGLRRLHNRGVAA
jgi:hypothetical protein